MNERKRRKKRKDLINRKAEGSRARQVLEDARARGSAATISEGPEIPQWVFEGLERAEAKARPGRIPMVAIRNSDEAPRQETLVVMRLPTLLKYFDAEAVEGAEDADA